MSESSETLAELIASSRVGFLAERVTELWATRMGDRADAVALGRFELDYVLGRGSYGVVFAAHDLELGRDVALKVFGEEAKQAALHEAQVLARVQHPNVVALHDVGHANGFHYLVMAQVDGWTMTQRVRMGLDWQTVVELFVQVGHGLAAVHRAGIIHGDVKPGNMLVGRDGHAYLADFGLAQSLVPEVPATIRGTREYMAPECREGAELGPWSCGRWSPRSLPRATMFRRSSECSAAGSRRGSATQLHWLRRTPPRNVSTPSLSTLATTSTTVAMIPTTNFG